MSETSSKRTLSEDIRSQLLAIYTDPVTYVTIAAGGVASLFARSFLVGAIVIAALNIIYLWWRGDDEGRVFAEGTNE